MLCGKKIECTFQIITHHINAKMDEHSIKKQRYLNTIFALSNGLPGILVLLVEIVKANNIATLDTFFEKISQLNLTGSVLYDIYKTTCDQNNTMLVNYIVSLHNKC
jgi:hypothetical protein